MVTGTLHPAPHYLARSALLMVRVTKLHYCATFTQLCNLRVCSHKGFAQSAIKPILSSVMSGDHDNAAQFLSHLLNPDRIFRIWIPRIEIYNLHLTFIMGIIINRQIDPLMSQRSPPDPAQDGSRAVSMRGSCQ